MAQRPQLHSLLIEIEQELKAQNLWQDEMPSAEALASQEPFAVDTLSFENWLQFILLPRMRHLLDNAAPLPASCHITEMAEMVWTEHGERLQLLTLLRQFDNTINAPDTGSVH